MVCNVFQLQAVKQDTVLTMVWSYMTSLWIRHAKPCIKLSVSAGLEIYCTYMTLTIHGKSAK
jgi:hypothetical protein